MTKIDMYRVERKDGGVDITPEKPAEDAAAALWRVIADDGMVLTDGEHEYTCVDTETPEIYTEIEDRSLWTDQDYIQAAKIMLGEV